MTNTRSLAGLGTFLALNLLIVIFLRDNIPAVADLYPDLPPGGHWFVARHAGLLYVLTPLLVTAAIITLLAPGLLIVLANDWAKSPGELMLKGFGATFVVHFLTTSSVKILFDKPLEPAQFLLLLTVTLIFAFAYLILRVPNNRKVFRIFLDRDNRAQIFLFFTIPSIFVIALLPAIFWQDLNADGFEAMEIGRSLATTVLPVFPTPKGTLGLGIGMLPMAYPIHWFIMLFGPLEAATRLPMALYVMVLFAGLLACIEFESPRRMRRIEQSVLLLGVAGYVTAISFNSGYDNYFTDLSSPPAFETLTVLLITGCCYFLWTGMSHWFLLVTVLGFLARPTILLIMGLLGIGIWIASPERRRPALVLIGAAIGLWVALLIGYEHIFMSTVADSGGAGYSGTSILSRFRYLTVTDLQRFLYAAAPVGVLPALSLLAYRWQDPLSRCITIVAAGYFLVFYVPAFVSLHHFVPVMILPLIVFWRLVLARANGHWPALVTAVITAAFIWLSLPQHFQINRTFREIGNKTAYLIGDYHGDFEDYRTAIRGTRLVTAFFRHDWDIDDPSRELVGGDQQVYYARSMAQPMADINYLVLPSGGNPPEGFILLKSDENGSAWVRDKDEWDRDRYKPAATGYRSRLYDISRETSFFYRGIPAHNYDINMGSLPLLWRLFPSY